VLVTQRQLVLYEYGADAKNRSNCSGACAKVWPPYLLATGVKTVHGPRDLVGLGTIRRGHRLQVSINGHPLYTFSGDHGVDQAHGQGFGGVWYVVSSSGHIVRTNVGAPAPVTSPPATSPPVTSPPATSPPVTSPPVTSPPATSPPVTSPPATSPPVTPPPTTSPPVTSPPTTSPPTTSPGGGGYGY
jgi:hypothetical protein